MLADILTVVLAVVFAVLVGFVARRLLVAPVGRLRSFVVGLLVFAGGLPFARWMLEQADLQSDSRFAVETSLVAISIVLLSLAWVFAFGVGVLVALEAIFPTRALSNPIDVVRAALQRRRRTVRYLSILAVASRHGAGWLLRGPSKSTAELTTSAQRADAVVSTINEAGATFVKLGQVLSTRRDLVPEPYLSALATLQSQASVVAWDAIRGELESELARPLEEIYSSIDSHPLAAASLAQVHAARLLDGSRVVVKVQRPGAAQQVRADTDIIRRLAHAAEQRSSTARDLHLTDLARAFTDELEEELDYRIEARNVEMIRATVEGFDLHIPSVHSEASTTRVLTMDLVDGVPLSRAADRLEALTQDAREALATQLMTAVMEQILVHGVFHADLHPGNVMLRDDDTLGLIDFGAVGVIERSQRELLTALLLATLSEDDVTACETLLLIVSAPPDLDVDAFRHDIGAVLTTERYRHGGDGSIFSRVLDVIREHRIALPGNLASAFRSFATLEGCLRVLTPDYDMVQRVLPIIPRLARHTVSVRRIAIDAQARMIVAAASASGLPRRVNDLLDAVRNGAAVLSPGASRGVDSDNEVWRSVLSQVVGTLISIAAVVVALMLVTIDAGPVTASGVHIFDLAGATVGLFGFLGLLRAMRQVVALRR